MTFKEQMEADLEKVFFNTDEFSDTVHVAYGKQEYDIPVVMESHREITRDTYKDDNESSIYIVDAVAHIRRKDLNKVPRKGRPIVMDSVKYLIAGVEHNGGEIILRLGRFDE